MSGRAWWVLSPTDGTAHLLAIEGPGGAVLATQCGQSLPLGVVAHDRLSSRHLRRDCFAAYLLPDPVFARKTPAGCRCSDAPESTPGGQPVPVLVPPRWARCPVDQHLHLLAPAQAQAAEIQGHERAGCGRLIPAVGLTIDGPAAGFCVSCMAVGTAQ